MRRRSLRAGALQRFDGGGVIAVDRTVLAERANGSGVETGVAGVFGQVGLQHAAVAAALGGPAGVVDAAGVQTPHRIGPGRQARRQAADARLLGARDDRQGDAPVLLRFT